MSRRFIEYYRDEKAYLDKAGNDFSIQYPAQGGLLNLSSPTKRDPYVERLLEGFAFLSGRIHERLDDELPQYTEHLFRLLYPHFIKPVPALSILAFTPRQGMVQQTTPVVRGTEVQSGRVQVRDDSDEWTVCRFTTAYTVYLHPMALVEVGLEWPDRQTSLVRLRFQLFRGATYQQLDWRQKPLRLFFAEPSLASMMQLFFTRHVQRVVIQAGETTTTLDGQSWVQPVGLQPEEALLPTAPNGASGHRLLQEYFCFPEKFGFVDLLGLDGFAPPEGATAFQVLVYFDRPYPEDRPFKTGDIQLYCTPIMNLFDAYAEPINVTHQQLAYRVIADQDCPHGVDVYDVQEVVGREKPGATRSPREHTYKPLFAFTHPQGKDRFYIETSRYGPTDLRETYLALGGFGEEVARLFPETLSVKARCTNANVPHDTLSVKAQQADVPGPAQQQKSIDQPAPGYNNIATFKNLTRPTHALRPPTKDQRQFFWQLLSHLSLNLTSVAKKETLKALLHLYDWTDADANRRRIAGIRDVKCTPCERPYRSKEMPHQVGIIRGLSVTLEVQDDHFTDAGDVNLFGTMLNAFFSTYVTLNAFVQLTVVSKPSNKSYDWDAVQGRLPLA